MFLKKIKGLSLVEFMISISILAIILTICSSLFSSSWRKLHSSNAMQDAHNSAVIGMDRFSRDFPETSKFHIINSSKSSPEKYISFPSPRDRNGVFQRKASGEPDWKTWIIYYLYPDPDNIKNPGNIRLYYLARKQIDGNLTTPPGMSEINNIQNATIAARNIYDFSVTLTPETSNLHSYNVRIETRRYYKKEVQSFEVNRNFSINDFFNQ